MVSEYFSDAGLSHQSQWELDPAGVRADGLSECRPSVEVPDHRVSGYVQDTRPLPLLSQVSVLSLY